MDMGIVPEPDSESYCCITKVNISFLGVHSHKNELNTVD